MPKNKELFEKCINPKKGVKPGLRKVKSNFNSVEQHIGKAMDNLSAMEDMFKTGHYDWVIICGYYAMYHAVLAALLLLGLRAFSHLCAITAFKLFYIEKENIPQKYIAYLKKAEKLSKTLSSDLDRTKRERVRVQYGVVRIKAPDVEWIRKAAKDFVFEIERTVYTKKGIKLRRA